MAAGMNTMNLAGLAAATLGAEERSDEATPKKMKKPPYTAKPPTLSGVVEHAIYLGGASGTDTPA